MNQQQYEKVKSAKGFIAALDQSGGSTPKALSLYGVKADAYSGEQQMYDLIHAMRTRIVTSPAFNGDRILGAILFEQTMDRDVEGRGTADYLWSVKNVVPFLKVDKGLGRRGQRRAGDEGDARPRRTAVARERQGHLRHQDALGDQACERRRHRRGRRNSNSTIGKQILAAGLMPIIEPEVDIHATDKQGAERLLKAAILQAARCAADRTAGDAQAHDSVGRRFLRRPREASEGAARRRPVGRLFSRRGEQAARPQPRRDRELLACADGRADRTAERPGFNKALDAAIGSIYAASIK